MMWPVAQVNAPCLSPALQLVLHCCRAVPDRDAIARMAHTDIDWPRLIKLAQDHHVDSLVYWNLRPARDAIPDDVISALHEGFQDNARRNLFLIAELLRVLSFLKDNGIEALPFKGPMLATQVYGNPALRCCGDLDLLVHESDALPAKQLLAAQGLQPIFPTSSEREVKYLLAMSPDEEREYFNSHWEYHLLRDDWLNIDLHWRIMPRELSLDFDSDRLWRRANALSLGGQSVATLSSEDLLLVLCANGAKDCWNRIDRICDIAQLLTREPDMDWPMVLYEAERMGARRIVRLGIELARVLLDAPLPAHADTPFHGDQTVRLLANQIIARFAREPKDIEHVSKLEQMLFHLRVRDRLSDRMRYGIGCFAPTVGDRASVPVPRNLALLHYLLRPLRVAGRLLPTGV